MIYGEFALSSNKGSAALIGTTIQPAGYIEFTILYRNYAKDYQCLYSNAYASGSKNRNEKGWLLNSTISIAANWKNVLGTLGEHSLVAHLVNGGANLVRVNQLGVAEHFRLLTEEFLNLC